MDAIFQKIIDNNFADLEGLTVHTSIRIPGHIINEIVEAALQGNKNIDSCLVSIGEQNLVSVNLKTPLWPWPINLKLRLEESVDLTNSPKINATLENNVLLGKLGAFFKALPEWININGDQVAVDVGSFLQTPEQKNFLDLIESIEIRTEMGRAIFDVKIKVDEEGG